MTEKAQIRLVKVIATRAPDKAIIGENIAPCKRDLRKNATGTRQRPWATTRQSVTSTGCNTVVSNFANVSPTGSKNIARAMQIMPTAVSDSARFDRKEEFVGKFIF